MPTLLLTLNDAEARALGELSARKHGGKNAADLVAYEAHRILTKGVTRENGDAEAAATEKRSEAEGDEEARRPKNPKKAFKIRPRKKGSN